MENHASQKASYPNGINPPGLLGIATGRRGRNVYSEGVMQDVDARLDRMIELADQMQISLDDIVRAIGRADQTIFDAVSERPSLLPRYIQSRVNP